VLATTTFGFLALLTPTRTPTPTPAPAPAPTPTLVQMQTQTLSKQSCVLGPWRVLTRSFSSAPSATGGTPAIQLMSSTSNARRGPSMRWYLLVTSRVFEAMCLPATNQGPSCVTLRVAGPKPLRCPIVWNHRPLCSPISRPDPSSATGPGFSPKWCPTKSSNFNLPKKQMPCESLRDSVARAYL